MSEDIRSVIGATVIGYEEYDNGWGVLYLNNGLTVSAQDGVLYVLRVADMEQETKAWTPYKVIGSTPPFEQKEDDK